MRVLGGGALRQQSCGRIWREGWDDEGRRKSPLPVFKDQEVTSTMNAKKSFAFTIALTVLVSALAFASVASADRIGVSINVNAPMPPLRTEVVIARPGPEFIWVRG